MTPKKTLAGLGATAILMGGFDASVLAETPLERMETIANERVEAKQIGNVVETTLPWKGETGLKVKYDMGKPTLAEKFADKRNKEVITETVDFGDGGFKVDILLNEKPATNVFCYQIEGAENYDFFYQPPLTAEEIAEGSSRPPEIEGSYAVYHKTLRDERIGGQNYATGKVMHIPRPQVWSMLDVETKVWADMQYNNGQLCVTVSQDFLDKAKYPVRVDPTFGYTVAGASSDTLTDDGMRGTYNNSIDSQSIVTSMTAYTGGGSNTNNSIATVMYYQSTENTVSGVGIVAGPAAGTFNWATSSAVSWVVSSSTYLLAIIIDATTTNTAIASYDTVTNAGFSITATYPTPPDPLGSETTNNNRYSIYATYDVSFPAGSFINASGSDIGFCYQASATSTCFTGETNPNSNVRIGYRTGASFGDITSGFRFSNVIVPVGSTITEARFMYTPFDTDNTSPPTVSIFAEATDNSTTFSTTTGSERPDTVAYGGSRATTSAFVSWTLPNQVINVTASSSDIKTVIQEVINRPGWASGNALTVFLATGDRVDNFNSRNATSSAALYVTYTAPAATSTDSGAIWFE